MRDTTTTRSLSGHLRSSWRILAKEISAFGLIGIAALVIDLSIFAALSSQRRSPSEARSRRVISTTFAYFGNRYLSFSHRARTSLRREGGVLLRHQLHHPRLQRADHRDLSCTRSGFAHGSAVVFAVNIVTIGMGTVFRYWAYKRFVFLHPDKVHAKHVNLELELSGRPAAVAV